MKAPFAATSTLTLRRVVFQADPTVGSNRTLHVSCGYLTQPPSGGAPVYRESWLQDLDADPTVSGFLQRAWQSVSTLDADFVGVKFNLRAVQLDLDAAGVPSIDLIYDVMSEGLELQRRMTVLLPLDSFWNRAIGALLANVQARML